MSRFLELIKQGVITVRLVTFVIVAALVYQWITQNPVPEFQKEVSRIVVIFWFGGETLGSLFKFLLERFIKHFEERH